MDRNPALESPAASANVSTSAVFDKPKSKLLVLRDRLLSPHLKEYRPQAVEQTHQQQAVAAAAAAAAAVGSGRPVSAVGGGGPSLASSAGIGSSSCCHRPQSSTDGSQRGHSPGGSRQRPRSSEQQAPSVSNEPPAMVVRDPAGLDAGGSRTAGQSHMTTGGKNNAPQPKSTSADGTGSSNGKPIPSPTAVKGRGPSSKPPKVDGGPGGIVIVRRSNSVRGGGIIGGRKPKRSVTMAEPTTSNIIRIDGVSSADELMVSSTSDDTDQFDDVSSGGGQQDRVGSPQIVSRQTAQEMEIIRGNPTVLSSRSSSSPLTRRHHKKRSSSNEPGQGQGQGANGDGLPPIRVKSAPYTSGGNRREQVPVVTAGSTDNEHVDNSTSASAHALNRIHEGVTTRCIVTDHNDDRTSRTRAVDGKYSTHSDTGIRPQRHLSDALHQPATAGRRQPVDAVSTHAAASQHNTREMMAVTNEVDNCAALLRHQSSGDVIMTSDETDDVNSGASSKPLPIFFRRNDRLRTSLRVVNSTNKSMERPLGMVFLVFRNKTESGLLPNEITSINTVWALFVRAFTNKLSMPWFEQNKWTIWILDQNANAFRILQDLRLIGDHSVLRLEESETCLSIDVSQTLPCYSIVSPTRAGSHMHLDRPPSRAVFRNRFLSDAFGEIFLRFTEDRNQRQPIRPRCQWFVYVIRKVAAMDRLSEMENKMDSLAALVRNVILRPSDGATTAMGSVDSLASNVSQITVQKAPMSPQAQRRTITSSQRQINSEDMRGRLITILSQSRGLLSEVNVLKQTHLAHVVAMSELLHETFIKLMNAMTSVAVSLSTRTVPRTSRQHLTEEQSSYCIDAARIDGQLKNLESCVEDMRSDVVGGRSRVVLTDVEAMTLALSHIGRSLAGLKGRLHHLQDKMRPVMASEIEVVVHEERFIKEEPQRLDKSVIRCKQLSGTLLTLKKLAMVQDSSLTPRPVSESDKGQGEADLELPTIESFSDSEVTKSATSQHFQNVDCNSRRPPTSATSPQHTVSAADRQKSLNGHQFPTDRSSAGRQPVVMSAFPSSGRSSTPSASSQTPATMAAGGGNALPVLPTPPPRQFVLQTLQLAPLGSSTTSNSPLTAAPTSSTDEIWQRHDSRSIKSQSHQQQPPQLSQQQQQQQQQLQLQRRSSTPRSMTAKSCPSSPFLDGSGTTGQPRTVPVGAVISRPVSAAAAVSSRLPPPSGHSGDASFIPTPRSSSSSTSSSPCEVRRSRKGSASGGSTSIPTTGKTETPTSGGSGRQSQMCRTVSEVTSSGIRRPSQPRDFGEGNIILKNSAGPQGTAAAVVDDCRSSIPNSGLRSPASGRYAIGHDMISGAAGSGDRQRVQQPEQKSALVKQGESR